MRILVGIDRPYEPTLNLLSRLEFASPDVLLAHSIQSVLPGPVYDIGYETFTHVGFSRVQEAAEELLCEAREAAKARKMPADMAVLVGSPATTLMDRADEFRADLIAVGSERKGSIGSLFLGSTTRALTNHAPQSVLICKGEVARSGNLRAVFATDHSPYAERAFRRFLSWHPAGIAMVHVVSAAHMGATPETKSPVEKQIEEERKQLNAEWVTSLAAAGYTATSSFSLDEANAAIRQAMIEQEGDLLVLGAQGHGFLHRLMLGTVALHQVAVEDYPVLVIRA